MVDWLTVTGPLNIWLLRRLGAPSVAVGVTPHLAFDAFCRWPR